ncbi:MAG: hypothetical protein ABIT07_11990 [Ferruginibacter sp.]
MSLDNIQMTPELVVDLYKKSLVDVVISKLNTHRLKDGRWPFWGNNEKKILIIVNEKNHDVVSDKEFKFLKTILSACSLSVADIALANFFTSPDMVYPTLMDTFSPQKIIFFGIEPSTLGFPLQFPYYQIQKYNDQTYLSVPSLGKIAADITQKKQLWNCLKTLFSST